MRRKDFLKSYLVLGAIPLMPNMLKTKEKLLSGVYGLGFRQKGGVCYGYWHKDNNELELLIVDYKRIPFEHKLLSSKPPCYGKPTDSLEQKRKYFADDMLNSKLYKLMTWENKEHGYPTSKEVKRDSEVTQMRLKKWVKWLSGRLNKED